MTLSEIKQDIYFMTQATSATYQSTDILRNVNVHYGNVARLIWESAGDWQFDDSNETDFGIATSTLVNDQQDYSLPTTAMRLQRVEIKDIGGTYQKLSQIDQSEIPTATSDFFGVSGLPLYYDIVGNSLFLYPKPSTQYVTASQGIKIYFDRTPIPLSDDSVSPGFASPFHRILSYATSIDFTRNKDDRNIWLAQKAQLEDALKKFYAKRNLERRGTIRPKARSFWRRYT